ncbi:MAG: methyltransferase [Xanthomonadales bacterium]|jgi:16S rRNA (guanine1207-N2)-methyltransferase|nr:methyltransferase [Xanthomonadales bacterium]
MENVSQIVLRNEARLPAGPLLLINPPRDALAQQLLQADRPVRCVTQDFGDFNWLSATGAEVAFEAVPSLDGSEQTVVLFLPREKDRLTMLLHAIADHLGPQAKLWLAGENRGGIKSSPRHVRPWFSRVTALDNARHCGLFEASRPTPARPFDLADYSATWSMRYAGRKVDLCSLPGVFAHGRLDKGSALLLAELEKLNPQGEILDFACGCGVVGLALLSVAPGAHLTLLDSSALALESSRLSLEANGSTAELLPSDGLAEVTGRYDWIVSNLPFHRGVANDLDIAAEFFRRAGTFLAENGRIVVVFNRHLPYSKWLNQSFDAVERLAENGEYIVIVAGVRRKSDKRLYKRAAPGSQQKGKSKSS